jgi:hypothetical protein
MTLTNKLSLPEPILRAVERDDYDRGKSDFTVTELLQPPRQRALVRQHKDEITEDVSDRLWALFGQIGHTILERAGMENLVERRFYATVSGKMIGGKADLILKPDQKAKLIDYKFCSHYTVKDGIKPEWTAQINMLRFLAWIDSRIDIDEAEIVAIYWPESVKHGNVKDPATVFPVELWDWATTTLDFISERIALHLAAEQELPLCSDEERWLKDDSGKFALMKLGRKTALKLHDTMASAQEHYGNVGAGHYIEERPKVYNRCERYCAAAPFCTQFNTLNRTS